MKNPVFLFKEFLKIVGVLAIAVPAVVLFAAWQEPSVSPTGGAGARDYWIFSSGSTNAIGAGKLSLGVDGSTAIAIDSSGNLGIGTASPGYKLDVQAGQINSSGGLCIAGDCKTAWSQVGGGGVSQITAGTNITITPTGGTGNVTINSSGGGGGGVP